MLFKRYQNIKVALLPEAAYTCSDFLDVEKARKSLIELIAVLMNDESDAHDVLEGNIGLLPYILGEELFVKVDQAIQSYDFEAVYNLLEVTEYQLNISLPLWAENHQLHAF